MSKDPIFEMITTIWLSFSMSLMGIMFIFLIIAVIAYIAIIPYKLFNWVRSFFKARVA